jgi:uncharacterized protein
MSQKIFVNLPVKDLKRSIEFFSRFGYNFNQQFADETATCMVISDHIYVMLLTEEKFKQIMPKDIVDSDKSTVVITCLSAESKDQVNEIVEKAIKAGATKVRDPEDFGFMFHRSFNDIDGHIWNYMWMDEKHVKAQ